MLCYALLALLAVCSGIPLPEDERAVIEDMDCSMEQLRHVDECAMTFNQVHELPREMMRVTVLADVHGVLQLRDTACKALTEFKTCAEPELTGPGTNPNCSPAVYNVYVDSLGHICTPEVRSILEQHGDCIAKTSQVPGVIQCIDKANQTIFSSYRNKEGVSLKQLCHDVDEAEACVRAHLEPNCGAEATEMLEEIAKMAVDGITGGRCPQVPQEVMEEMVMKKTEEEKAKGNL